MSRWIRGLSVGVMTCMIVTGCAGSWPVRWPSHELWASSPVRYEGLRLPSGDVESYPNHLEEQGVAVGALLFTPDEARERVHVALLRDRIQPLMLVVRNNSDQTYMFRKADVDARYLPARCAAKSAQIYPVVHAVRLARWLVWLLPGVLFSAVIEPSTGLPFEGIDQIASRPPTPRNHDVTDDFLRHEIADGPIGPHESLSGLMFLRPPKLWSTLHVQLINTQTREPLLFVIPTRAPVVLVAPVPHDTAWQLVTESAAHLASWRVVSSDTAGGTMTLRRGGRFFLWTNETDVSMSMKQLDEHRTQVTVESPPRRTGSLWCGARGQMIDQAIEELILPLRSLIEDARRASMKRSARTSTSNAQSPSEDPNAVSSETTPAAPETAQSAAAP